MKDILKGKDLDKHQRKALIASKDHKEYIIEPNTLDPLITIYEKSNKTLKFENDALRSDTTRLCDSLEVLIKDNAKLREFINKKNEDISKTLNVLSQEEGEYIIGLKDNIEIIEEENKHLIFKIQQLEEMFQREKDEHEEIQRIMGLGKHERRRLKEDLDELKLKDRGNIEKLTLVKEKMKDFENKYEKEKYEKDKLRREFEKMKNDENMRLNKSLKGRLSEQIEVGLGFGDASLNDINELKQEVVFLREENDFLKEKLRVNMSSLKHKNLEMKIDKEGSDPVKKNLELKLEKLSKEVKEKDKFKTKYEKTLKKLRILQSIESDIHKPSSSMKVGSGQIPDLKEQLRKKSNELKEEKRKNKDYVKEMEKVNSDILRRLSKDNEHLKKEKGELLAKVNKMLHSNVKTTQRLDLAEVYLENDAAIARIRSLEEDNKRLRKKLSEMRIGGAEPDLEFGEKVLNLKSQMLQKDKDYKEALKKLHQDLKNMEGERINQQHYVEKQNAAIKKMYSALEKEKKDKNVLSSYINKIHQSLKGNEGDGGNYDVPDFIKNHMNQSEPSHTPRSVTSQMSKEDIQKNLRNSHHEKPGGDINLERVNMMKKKEKPTGSEQKVRFADKVEEKLIEKVPKHQPPQEIKKYVLPDGRVVGEPEYQQYVESLNNGRPSSAPRQINGPLVISEEGVRPQRGARTHAAQFFSPRPPYNLPPPRRGRRHSHGGIEMRRRSESPDRIMRAPPRIPPPRMRPDGPRMDHGVIRDARDIVSSAYERTMGEYNRDPMMDTMSSQITLGMRSAPRMDPYRRFDDADSVGGGINDLIQRYNETDLYKRV